MGNKEIKSTLKIVVIGGENKFLEQIFPFSFKNDKFKQISDKLKIPYECKKYIKKFEKLDIEIIWEAFILQDLTENNIGESLKLISKMIDLPLDDEEESDEDEKKKLNSNENNNSEFDRKYIVIKFGTEKIECLINMINILSRVHLPQIAIVTDEYLDDNNEYLYDNRFLTVIQEDKKDQTNTIKNIFSYLWDRESYYNQRGNELNEYLPSNILKIDNKINSYINILITGISRTGKSTLINLLSKKLVALESSEGKSITTEIKEYIIERNLSGSEEKIGIKLIDTPGLKKFYDDKTKKYIDSTKSVQELIEKKLKECKDSKDDIHMIYFIFGNNPNFEDYIDFFKFLKKINKERIENEQKKIPIIFIGNFGVDENGIDALKKILKDNNLMDLYEKIGKTKKKIDFKKDFCSKNKNKKNLSLENNIIGVNLLKGNNKNVYGIDNILNATLYFLEKNNEFKNFQYLEELNEKIQIYLTKINNKIDLSKEEEENFRKLKEKIKNQILELSKENSLLNQIKNPNDIIEKANEDSKKIIFYSLFGGFAAGIIPFPLLDIPFLIPIYATMIIKIGNCFTISFSEIDNNAIVKLIFGLNIKISKSSNYEDDNMISKVQGAKKIIINPASYFIGEDLGKDLAKNLGENKIKDWAKRKLRYVGKGGKNIFHKEIKEIGVNQTSKFNQLIESLMQFFPIMKKGAENGVNKSAKQLGEEVGKIYTKNSFGVAAKEVAEHSTKRSSQYAMKISTEANKYFATFSKIIPILGSIIGGIMDAYGVYVIGDNAIKYFNEYVNKSLGSEYLIKKKKIYLEIFKNIDLLAKENYEQFDINYIY